MKYWWVLYQGRLSKIPVFNEKSAYKNQVKFPAQGTKGYAVIDHAEVELCFDEEYHVFHVPGVKPVHFKEILASREEIHAHS